MNNLVVVILSVSFLAVSIPSVFSTGELCGQNRQCYSKKSECCLTNATATYFYKSCQPVTDALLTATFSALKTLPGTSSTVANLGKFLQGLVPGLPLPLNNKFCKAYDTAQVTLVKAGIIVQDSL